MGVQKDVYGISIGFLRYFYEFSMSFRWDFCGIPMIFQMDFYDISMGLLWDA